VAASGCSAFGTDALRTNFSGIRNTAIGAGAGNNNYIGGLNVAVGFNALYSNNLGSSHVAVGDSALSNVSGYSYNNTALGTDAGITLVSGSQNTLLGYKADVDASGRNSCVCLGSGTKTPPLDGSFAVGGKESPFIMGNLLSPHAGGNSGQHWIVYLNGTQYRIKLENPPA
jgi:hypothetical protein